MLAAILFPILIVVATGLYIFVHRALSEAARDELRRRYAVFSAYGVSLAAPVSYLRRALRGFEAVQPGPMSSAEDFRRYRGEQGELAVMLRLANAGVLAVYWGVYIRGRDGRTCEVDHLVVLPEGVLLLETKNLRGIWEGVGTAVWRKKGPGSNFRIMRSPVEQALRARSILTGVLRDLGLVVPIGSIVLYSTQAQLRGADPRVPMFPIDSVREAVAMARGCGKAAPSALPALLRFMRELASAGVYPSFYDRQALLNLVVARS